MNKVAKTTEALPQYSDWLMKSLKSKRQAAAYLQAAIEEYQVDNDPAPLLLAFRQVAIAQGGMTRLAEKAHLNRETLYRTLSRSGNPKLKTIGCLLQGLGFRLAVQAK